jgi:hypothetical protein
MVDPVQGQVKPWHAEVRSFLRITSLPNGAAAIDESRMTIKALQRVVRGMS